MFLGCISVSSTSSTCIWGRLLVPPNPGCVKREQAFPGSVPPRCTEALSLHSPLRCLPACLAPLELCMLSSPRAEPKGGTGAWPALLPPSVISWGGHELTRTPAGPLQGHFCRRLFNWALIATRVLVWVCGVFLFCFVFPAEFINIGFFFFSPSFGKFL